MLDQEPPSSPNYHSGMMLSETIEPYLRKTQIRTCVYLIGMQILTEFTTKCTLSRVQRQDRWSKETVESSLCLWDS